MYLKRLIKITLFLTIVLLAACARYHKHGEKNYARLGQSISPLVIPPGVPAIKQEPYYLVPSMRGDVYSPVSLVPPGSNLASHKNTLKKSHQ